MTAALCVEGAAPPYSGKSSAVAHGGRLTAGDLAAGAGAGVVVVPAVWGEVGGGHMGVRDWCVLRAMRAAQHMGACDTVLAWARPKTGQRSRRSTTFSGEDSTTGRVIQRPTLAVHARVCLQILSSLDFHVAARHAASGHV